MKMMNALLNNKLMVDKFSKITLNLKNLEHNTFITVSESLLISSFVAAFYL
jgi:hypothetical protein